MTIHYLHGNIVKSNANVRICTTNTFGRMGKGIALDFKKAYPDLYKGYQDHCENPEHGIKHHYVYEQDGRYIYCFHTKHHWRENSSLQIVQRGLYVLYHWLKKHPKVESVAMPPLGCGNGNLDFKDVLPMILKFADQFPNVVFELYCPEHFHP